MRGRPAPPSPAEPDRLGPYRLLRRLGAGGMGVVYLGDRGGGPVAIKVLRPELAADPAFRARFRSEVRAAARVGGARTARVVDADADGPTPYLVTEYVEGPTLWQAVDLGGPFRGERLESLAAGVADALAAIHASGLVHRDLKPSNVLLGRSGPTVIDFGIARAADAAVLTRTGLRVGTPAWMAPEQFREGPVTAAADVFAWGALVAFAATGRPPFGSGPAEAVAYRIIHQAPDLGTLAGTLRQLVEAATAKDPARRPTARRLLHQLAPAEAAGRTWQQELHRPGEAAPGPDGATGTSAAAPATTAPTWGLTDVLPPHQSQRPRPGLPPRHWPAPAAVRGLPEDRRGQRPNRWRGRRLIGALLLLVALCATPVLVLAVSPAVVPAGGSGQEADQDRHGTKRGTEQDVEEDRSDPDGDCLGGSSSPTTGGHPAHREKDHDSHDQPDSDAEQPWSSKATPARRLKPSCQTFGAKALFSTDGPL